MQWTVEADLDRAHAKLTLLMVLAEGLSDSDSSSAVGEREHCCCSSLLHVVRTVVGAYRSVLSKSGLVDGNRQLSIESVEELSLTKEDNGGTKRLFSRERIRLQKKIRCIYIYMYVAEHTPW